MYERETAAIGEDRGEDVYLDVPELHVDSLEIEVEDLRARVSLQADVLSLLRLHVGIDATLGRVRLDLKGVDAQALLKVRLDNVAEILKQVLATINANPQIVEELARGARAALTETGIGARQLLTETGPGVGEAVAGATEGLELGLGGAAQGVGRAAEQAGEAVGEAARQVGQAGAGSAEPPAGRPGRRGVRETSQRREWRAEASPEGDLGGEPSLEARAAVDAESWHAGERQFRQEPAEPRNPPGASSGERPRRRLPRRDGPEGQ
ncbi:hypothetical protein [Micromonospora sp. IBHARD004]|uniref:hypothetical protein n=1 Tax=Micromonospora sp. IBHARD004 TaxID=3457764 RepID=UPI004058E20C